jgi:hypothetical protein
LSTVEQRNYPATHYPAHNPNPLPHHSPPLLSSITSGSSILTPRSRIPPTNSNPSTSLGSTMHSTAISAAGNPTAAMAAPASPSLATSESDARRERQRAPAAAWNDNGAAYVGGAVGDPGDPYLDGMYQDETGLASVCC